MRHQISERVYDILEWGDVLREIQTRCATEAGKARCTVLNPLDRETAALQMGKITEIRKLMIEGEDLDFGGIRNIEASVRLASKGGVLKIEELSQIRSFTRGSGRVRSFLKRNGELAPRLAGERENLPSLEVLEKLLAESITDNDELSQSRYPALRRISDEIHSLRDQIEKTLLKMMNSPEISKMLQERVYSTRNERYVILVKANFKGRVRGTVHDVSASEATLFVEPDAVADLNNRLLMRRMDLQAEIQRILRQLSSEVEKHSEDLYRNYETLSYLDFLNGASRFSRDIDGHEPEISEERILDLYNVRHPLLYLMKPGRVVSNDVSLGLDYSCLIISGANTGGKTVLLKTLGLCALLALHGLHLPAGPDSRLGLFSGVFADIGDDQNLAQSLSTFSGQIVNISGMIDAADEGSLVLIDEIVVGTNPRQGAALSQSILEKLARTGARIVVTTHYTELKELASLDGRFRNASVSFDLETLAPTYRLTVGIPGVSYALEIARTYGIDPGILERARELLDERELSYEALIEKVQRYEEELAEERHKLAELRGELDTERERLRREKERLGQMGEEIKSGRGLDFLEEIRRYRDEVAARIRDLQQADMKEAGRIQEDLIALDEAVTRRMGEEEQKKFLHRYGVFDPSLAEKGGPVFVIPLRREGTLEDIDPEGSAEVRLGGGIKSRFPFADLLLPRQDSDKKANARPLKDKKERDQQRENFVPLTVQTRYNTIDLRGMRVDEALSRLEGEMDRMSRSGIHSAVIIHGHGTGALKEAVRQALKYSHYASAFRAGEQGEGGDGVTIAVFH